MKKHLQKWLLILAMMVVPWMSQGQSLSEYTLTVDTTTFQSIRTTGSPLSFTTTDDGYATTTLPFNFNYGNSTFLSGTSIACSANGFLRLGATSTSGTTASYSSTSDRLITAFLQQDAHIGRYTESGAYYKYDAADSTFTIEYHLLGTYTSPYGVYSYQVVLHMNGDIEFVYDTANLGTTDSRTFATYLTDGPENDRLFLTGSWANPTVSTTYGTRPYTTLPAHGLRYRLTRPYASCPKPTVATVTNVTDTSFDFSWEDVSSASEYQVQLLAGNLPVLDTIVGSGSTSYTFPFSDLLSNTVYTARVATICQPGDTSFFRMVQVRTLCGAIAALPFQETFENEPTGSSTTGSAFVQCWTLLNNGTSYGGYPYVNSSTTYNHTPNGTKGLYWYNTTTTGTYGDYQCIVLPPVDTALFPTNTLQLKFWAKSSSTSYNITFTVGVLTDPTDINTYQTVATVNHGTSTTWTEHTVALNNYTGTGRFVAIRADRGTSSWYAYVDDVTLDYIPTCPAVDNITATHVTTSSALVGWQEQDTATSWMVEYGPAGFQPGTGTSMMVTTDTVTITGLTANTEYEVYVIPACADNRAGRNSLVFRTNCTGLASLPYVEDFESTPTGSSTSNAFVDCWHHLNNGSDFYGYPYVSSSSTYSHGGGTKGLYWYNTTTTGTYGDYMCIVLPFADTALYPLNTLQLSFWARSSSTSYYPIFQVGVMSDPNDISTFQQVATVNVSNTTAWGEYITSFENYSGTGLFPAIKATRGSSSWYCYMDEIRLEPTPDCPHVQNLAATRITNSSALISWNDAGTASSWAVEYGIHGFVPGSGTAVTASSDTLTLTGLSSGTEYDVYVTPVCTPGTSAEFRISFTTNCNDLDTLPYFENFESAPTGSTSSTTFVNCWHRLNNGTMYFGYPYVSSSSSYSHNGGTRGLYWYNTTTTGTYGDYQYVVLPSIDTNLYAINQTQLKFWAKPSSSSYHPVFDIGIMTDPNDPNTFQHVYTFTIQSADWEECFVPFTAFTGYGNFVAVRALRSNTSWYAYVDEFTLEIADPCANVYDLVADNVGYLGAGVSWNTRGGTEEIVDFTVELIPADPSETPFSFSTTDSYYSFTNLNQSSEYKVRVRANCTDSEGSWDSLSFYTMSLPCVAFDSSTLDTIIFSNSTTTGTSGILVYSGYGNTVCQTIFTAQELTTAGLTAGPITAIDLGFSVNSSYAKEFSIMMANTSKQTFSSSTDMENMSNHQLLYGPAPHPLNTSGWQHYEFTTPFSWDGTSNIIMTTFMNQPPGVSHTASSFNGYYTTGSGTRLAYRYQDSSPYTTSNYTGGSSGGTSSSRPSIHFYTGECIEYASCLPSIAWVSNSDSNGVELSWLPSYLEDTWDIDYREIDSTEWHNVETGTSDNSYLFTDLEAATRYQLRVSHTCNDSLYETIVEVMTPGAYYMQTTGTQTLSVCRSVIYDDGGPDGSYSNSCDATLILYPEDTSRTLRIVGTYTGEGCCDYIGIYDGTSSSGRQLFYNCSPSSGQTINIGPFTSETGALTVTFHSDPSVVYPGFELRTSCVPVPHCADIVKIKTTTVGTQAANVIWRAQANSRYGDPIGFEYIILDSLRNEVAHDTTSELSHFFTGLAIESQYTVMVRTLCPDDQYGNWDSVVFTTNGLPCVEFDTSLSRTVVFSNGTGTATGVFVTSAWGNSFCQSIFTAEELNQAGVYAGLITGVTLGYSSTASYNKEFTIMLTTSNSSEFSSSSEYIQIDSSMIVYGPAAHPSTTNGWVNYTFDTPFAWDGSSNLVLTTTMNQPPSASHSSSGFYSYNTDCGATRTVYRYRDSSPWTVSNYSSGNSSTSTSRPSITFMTTGCSSTGTCAAPTVIVDSLDHDFIALRWAPGYFENSWQVEYRPANDTTWIDRGYTSADTMTLTGLIPDMTYHIRVTAQCGDTVVSRRITATTLCMPAQLPLFEDFESWSTSSATPPPACWARFSNYSSGTYPYASTSYSVYPGSKSLYFYATGSTNTAIILPRFDAPIDSISLSFMLMRTNTSYSHAVSVGVMTDPDDYDTYVPIGTATPTAPLYQFEGFEFDFRNYTGNGRYIAITTSNSDAYCYPYLDNIEVYRYSSCRRVTGVTQISTTLTTSTIGWDTTNADTYDIEYGPTGFTRGTGTRINGIAADNTTITGLNPGTEYDVYVRGNCSPDSSAWSFQYTFLTECLLIDSLPYFDGLENWRIGNSYVDPLAPCWTRLADAGTIYYYPYLSSSSTYNHTPGGSKGLYWYRSSSAGSYGSYNGVVLPGIDTTVYPMDTLELSFWAKNSGSYTSRFVIGILTDPADNNTFTPCDTVVLTSQDWTQFFVNFINYTGHGNYIGVRSDLIGTDYFYAYVDDFTVDVAPPCLLFNVQQNTDVPSSDTRLAVKWDDNGAGQYQVVCVPAGDPVTSGTPMIVTTNSVVITGLNASTQYDIYVRGICDITDTGRWVSITLVTDMCPNATVGYNYDNSMTPTTSSYGPIGYATYENSYVQTIIDSAHMAAFSATPIAAFAFNATNTVSSDYYTGMDVYMANIPEDNLSSGFILPNATTHQFVQLISNGNFNFTEAGWHVFAFDTTFTWDGHSNVLFAVNRHHGSWSSSTTFAAHSTSTIRTRYIYQDGTPYSITNPTGGSTGTGSYVGDLQFITCDATPPCNEPEFISDTHDYHMATISWLGDGNNFEINIKETTASEWPATDISVAANNYTFTGLIPSTDYTFRVRQDCTADSNGYSEWVEYTFTTDSILCFPPHSLHVTDVTNATATFDWITIGTENMWEIHVWTPGDVDSIYRVTSHPVTVGGFTAGLTYNAAARALCGTDMYESDWSSTITFTTAICPNVTNVTAGNVTDNSALITWNNDTMAQSWIVEYGYAGFDQGSGTIVPCTSNSFNATGLECETSYDFYVRAVCGTDWTSENWSRVSFTTDYCAEPCDAPFGVTATVNLNNVDVSWTPGEGNTAFEVEYGSRGFSHGSGTTVNATEPHATLTGLDYNTQYDLYVRALCGADNYSGWSPVTTFTTGTEGISSADGATCTIFPNPATSSTTITVGGVNGKVKIEVVDMNGRTVASETLECNSDCVKTMEVDKLAQGTYFVRISGEQVNMVRKLIVR